MVNTELLTDTEAASQRLGAAHRAAGRAGALTGMSLARRTTGLDLATFPFKNIARPSMGR